MYGWAYVRTGGGFEPSALSLELVRPFGPIPSVVSYLGGSRLGSPVGELSAKQTEGVHWVAEPPDRLS